MECLAKDLDTALDLLMDVLRQPAFPEAEIKKMIAQRTDELRAMKDEPSEAIRHYYRSFYFGPQHPYGRPADELTLSRIKRADLNEYHRRMYVGRNMIIAAAGDIDPSSAAEKLAARFGQVPEGQPYLWKKIPGVIPQGTRIAIIDKPDATQTNFVIGQPGIQRSHPDRIPLWLVNTLFGGRFTSMLNDELRVNSGLTYGAGSVFDQYHLPGRITISSFTKTETTAKAIDLALEVLNRLRENGISAEQLSSAKAYLKGTYPSQRLETADQLAGVLTEIELFDLNRSEVDDLFARIDAVTIDRANAIARTYYKADNLTFVLLGNAAKFGPEVSKYGDTVARTEIEKPGFRVAE
jgi:predicted Zn-dependent peptidase